MIVHTQRHRPRDKYIIDHHRGYGLSDDWDYLERCTESERVKAWCHQRWQSACNADEMIAFNGV